MLDEPYRPSGEPLLLATAWLCAARLPGRAAFRAAIGVVLGLYVLLRVDRAGFRFFMGQEPLAYDQLFLVRHLFVLMLDLFSPVLVLTLVGVIVTVVLIVLLLRKVLRALSLPATQPARTRALWTFAGLWAIAIAGSFVPAGARRAVSWETQVIAANVRESIRIYDGVHARLGASPYAEYDRIKLGRKPDVYLFLVESYGRVMLDQPYLRDRYLPDIERMARRLAEKGWYGASAFTAAPVKGGRSWLAEASLLMGMPIAYEAEFQHVLSQPGGVPHIVKLLANQGYHTVLLAPADRERPGLVDINHYGYDERVRFDQLFYRGKRWGWGIVPDQYSLSFTHERYLARAQRPLFFNFHMVTSHAPWKMVPKVVSDWRTLRDPAVPALEGLYDGSPFRALKHFIRDNDLGHMGELKNKMARRYRKAIAYDLEVITRYLRELQGDALVLVIGDHQPPVISSGNERFDTPVHVLARDPALLTEFWRSGFVPNLRLGPETPTVMKHEGLFSLLARALVGCCGEASELPPFLRAGAGAGEHALLRTPAQ